jgi:hypothetical protein
VTMAPDCFLFALLVMSEEIDDEVQILQLEDEDVRARPGGG